MRTVSRLLGLFVRHDEAVAAVEFALILPFMLALYFGSMEASSLYTADRRVNTISATMGDLVSRWDPTAGNDSTDGKIPVATMNDYFAASTSLIYPMSTTGLKIVLTCVQVNSDGTTKVIWSRGYNGGAAKTVNSSYTLTSQMNLVARGGYIIASQTYYDYKPMLGVVFDTALNLYHENLYLPRYGKLIELA